MKNDLGFKILSMELKKILKNKKIKYTTIARKLSMSESSVKRLMTSDDISLSKLQEICHIAGITLLDLLEVCKKDTPKSYSLTKEQSRFFSKNPYFFEFFSLLYHEKKSVAEVKKMFSLDDLSISLYLKKLEQLQMLERHPKNKVKFLIEGGVDINSIEGLGGHIINKALLNFSNLILNTKDLKKFKEQGLPSTFSLSDIYVRKETAKDFCEEIKECIDRFFQNAKREEKVYDKKDLTCYSQVIACLPTKLYQEEVPLIKKIPS